MSAYTVFPINLTVSPSHLASYKALRLASLQIDPQAFASNYAREVAFSEDAWRERLDATSKRTFVAAAQDTSSRVGIQVGERGDVDDAGETGEATDEWIGMASIVGPSVMHPSVLAPFREVGMGANWEINALYGMWVHPAHRGKGVGAELVRACLEWVRANVDTKLSSENSGVLEKVVVLLVYEDNAAGRALYSRVGFTDLEGVPSKEREKWMLARV